MKRRSFLKHVAGGTAVAAAVSLPAPAIAQGIRELKMATTWPKDFPGLGTSANRLAERITQASGGALRVTVFAGDALVPALQSYDAVTDGIADLYHGTESYWQSKSKAFNFFTGVPFGLTPAEHSAWIRHGGAQRLWDELSAPFNVKPFLVGNAGSQMGGWFKTPVTSLSDLRDRKIRMTGLGGEVMRALGASALTLPGSRIVGALREGTIDAAEWAGPWIDLAAGIYSAARYYYYPGFQEPGMALASGLRRDIWEQLPADQQALIEAAMAAEYTTATAEFDARNSQALNTLVQQHNVAMTAFPNEVLNAIGAAAGDVVYEAANTDGAARQVYESYITFRRRAIPWSKFSTSAYLRARALPFRYDTE